MILLNVQPVEKPDRRADGSLEVFRVWETLQGEGPLAGTPAVFVRLAGCDLRCPGCDTDYTSRRIRYSVGGLLAAVKSFRGSGLVVFTGGEPLRQGLAPAIGELLRHDYTVQIETNGTLHDPAMIGVYADVSVVCSPKTPRIHNHIAMVADIWKYVLAADAKDPIDGLPTSALGMPWPPARPPLGTPADRIFVQPLDEQDPVRNRLHIEAAVVSCLRHGYRLSMQLHKFLGLE